MYPKEVNEVNLNGEKVRMRLPAEPFSRQLIRLAVYIVASRMEYNLAQLEDLRLAIDEASTYALGYCSGKEPLEVEIDPGKEYLEIILTSKLAEHGETRSVMPESLSRLIMESAVDSVDVQRDKGICRVTLRKRSP